MEKIGINRNVYTRNVLDMAEKWDRRNLWNRRNIWDPRTSMILRPLKPYQTGTSLTPEPLVTKSINIVPTLWNL